MYQNYYPNYNAYAQIQQPFQPTPQAAQQPQAPQSNIQWVQGIEAAKSYLVAAGNSVMLMDSENSTFYIKSTDNSGMPQPMRIFDYAERKQQNTLADGEQYVTRKELDEILAKITEEKTNE